MESQPKTPLHSRCLAWMDGSQPAVQFEFANSTAPQKPNPTRAPWDHRAQRDHATGTPTTPYLTADRPDLDLSETAVGIPTYIHI